jgi:hypothetical protein
MTLGRRRLILLAAMVAVIGHQVTLAAGDLLSRPRPASLHATVHGTPWLLAVLAVAVAVLAGLAIATWRIRSLRRRLVAAAVRVPWSGPPARTDLLAAWLRILAVALLAFLVQENLEHLTAHGHLPLLEPLLEGQYAASLPTFAGLALLAASLGLRLGRRIADLAAALAAAIRSPSRAPQRLRMPVGRLDDMRDTARRAYGRLGRRAPPRAVLV